MTTTRARSTAGRPFMVMATYSRRAIAATITVNSPKPSGSRQNTSSPRSGSPTTAEAALRRRLLAANVRSQVASAVAPDELFPGAAEAALTAPVGLHGPQELVPTEVRPEGVGEVELRVGGLPEEEVGQPLFP